MKGDNAPSTAPDTWWALRSQGFLSDRPPTSSSALARATRRLGDLHLPRSPLLPRLDGNRKAEQQVPLETLTWWDGRLRHPRQPDWVHSERLPSPKP